MLLSDLHTKRRLTAQHDATQAIGQLVDIAMAHQGPLLFLDPDAQQRRLGRGNFCISCGARRLAPLAPQVSQVGNAALVEQEAVSLPLDHAFGFELADIGPAAIEVLRQR